MRRPLPAKKANTSPTLPLGSTVSDGQTAGVMGDFPSEENLKALRRIGIVGLHDDVDLWRYHAYQYGFRRVVLRNFDGAYPMDPDGEWLDPYMVDRAEEFWRRKLGKGRQEIFARASSPDDIRPECRRIPAHQLTPAEAAMLAPEIEAMAARLHQHVSAIGRRGRRAVLGPRQAAGTPAPEIPPPKGFETAKVTPERAAELLGALDGRGRQPPPPALAPRQAPPAARPDRDFEPRFSDDEPPPVESEEEYGT